MQLVVGLDVDLLELERQRRPRARLEPGARLVAEVAVRPRVETSPVAKASKPR